jgi:hypothetical protein
MKNRVEEEGIPIDDFPGYEISNYGRVYNLRMRRMMVLSPTQHGDLTVGLTRDSYQYRYSVKGLVARAFCSFEYLWAKQIEVKAFVYNWSDTFNTPTLLDGDKHNLYFENIVWRPRWFAWRYSNQFTNPMPWYRFGPIQDVGSGIMYESYMEAAIENGILCSDIRRSIYEPNRLIFPTYQNFAYVSQHTNLS